MYRKHLVALLLACLVFAGCSDDDESTAPDDYGPGTETGEVADIPICAPDLLDCAEADPVEAAGANAAPDSSADYTVNDYLTYVIADIDGMWSTWFASNGFTEPMVGYEIVVPGDTYTTTCNMRDGSQTVDANYANAFYCPNDVLIGSDGLEYQGVIVLPETTFRKMWEGNIFELSSASVGDFAAAIITAHEFGHHIQDEILLQLEAADPSGTYGEPNGKNQELIADCFAGVWMNSAYYKNMLIDTDYQEAIDALYAIGDQGVSSDPHGTPDERVEAVTAGYNSGQPVSCIETYWQ